MKRRPEPPKPKGLNDEGGLSRILIADEGEETFTIEQIRQARG